MTFLTSLLPGVREVRSALFAGYLWIAITYVGVQIWADGNSGAPFDILEERLSQTPQLWEFVVVSIAAYFVGSISRALFDAALLHLVDSTAKDIPRLREQVEASAEGNWEAAWNRRKRAVRNVRRLRTALDPRISPGQRSALETFLEEQWTVRVLHVINRIQAPMSRWDPPEELRRQAQRVARLLPLDVRETLRSIDGFKLSTIQGRAPHIALAEAVVGDTAVMRIRLLSSDAPQLAAEVDRHENEAELRTAVFVPLTVAGVVLGLEYWFSGGLLLILGAAVFFVQGLQRRRQARDLVIQALIADEIDSPLLAAAEAEAEAEAEISLRGPRMK